MRQTTEKRSRLAHFGGWVAELVLVFVGVYAAFWLNNYQQHRQDAERRDQILAALEQQFAKALTAEKLVAQNRNKKRQSFGALRKRVKCRRCSRLFSSPITAQST